MAPGVPLSATAVPSSASIARRSTLGAMVLVLGCAPAAPPLPVRQSVDSIRDRVIVPGERIGPAYLGMPLAQMLDVLGEPADSTAWGMEGFAGTSYRYGLDARGGARNFIVVRTSDLRVRVVGTHAPEFEIAGGVRVGSSQARVVASLGNPAHVRKNFEGTSAFRESYCYREGLSVVLDGSGLVQYIQVFPREDYAIAKCSP